MSGTEDLEWRQMSIDRRAAFHEEASGIWEDGFSSLPPRCDELINNCRVTTQKRAVEERRRWPDQSVETGDRTWALPGIISPRGFPCAGVPPCGGVQESQGLFTKAGGGDDWAEEQSSQITRPSTSLPPPTVSTCGD